MMISYDVNMNREPSFTYDEIRWLKELHDKYKYNEFMITNGRFMGFIDNKEEAVEIEFSKELTFNGVEDGVGYRVQRL